MTFIPQVLKLESHIQTFGGFHIPAMETTDIALPRCRRRPRAFSQSEAIGELPVQLVGLTALLDDCTAGTAATVPV